MRAAGACAAALLLASAAALDRPYFGGGPVVLNTTTLQLDVDESIPMAGDWDIAVLDLDSWGVPWDSFIYEQPLPYSYATKLNLTLAAWAKWKLPLILSLPMGDGDSKRSCPSQNATDAPGSGGRPNLQPVGGCVRCFDWSEVSNPVAAFFRQGYTNYVLAMIGGFKALVPTAGADIVGVSFAIDSNRVLEAGCGEAWLANYIAFSNQLYDSVKLVFPDFPIFPSFSIETFYGLRDGQACSTRSDDMAAPNPSRALLTCFDDNYAKFATMKRDVFAFTALPSQTTGNKWAPWYFSAALYRLDGPVDTTNKWLMSTGVIADDLVVNAANQTQDPQPTPECVTILPGNSSAANSWLATAATQAQLAGVQVVALAQARDLLFAEVMTSCPCTAPSTGQFYCAYLNYVRLLCVQFGLPSYACEASAKTTGTTGVRDLLNSKKQPIYDTLQAIRATPPADVSPFAALLGAAKVRAE